MPKKKEKPNQELDQVKSTEKIKDEEVVALNHSIENITDDPNAPLLYRRNFIQMMCVVFSTFTGSVLMAINLFQLKKKGAAIGSMIVGLVYTIVTALFLIPLSATLERGTTILVLVTGIVGHIIIDNLFWKTNVPPGFEFRKRRAIPTLLIVILIIIVLIVVYTNL